jgi:hypothetical protein
MNGKGGLDFKQTQTRVTRKDNTDRSPGIGPAAIAC